MSDLDKNTLLKVYKDVLAHLKRTGDFDEQRISIIDDMWNSPNFKELQEDFERQCRDYFRDLDLTKDRRELRARLDNCNFSCRVLKRHIDDTIKAVEKELRARLVSKVIDYLRKEYLNDYEGEEMDMDVEAPPYSPISEVGVEESMPPQPSPNSDVEDEEPTAPPYSPIPKVENDVPLPPQPSPIPEVENDVPLPPQPSPIPEVEDDQPLTPQSSPIQEVGDKEPTPPPYSPISDVDDEDTLAGPYSPIPKAVDVEPFLSPRSPLSEGGGKESFRNQLSPVSESGGDEDPLAKQLSPISETGDEELPTISEEKGRPVRARKSNPKYINDIFTS